MKRFTKLFFTFFLFLVVTAGLSSCKSSQSDVATSESIKPGSVKKIAIVSFAVNNYGAMYGQGSINPGLIKQEMSTLLKGTEEFLSTRFEVVKLESFIGKDSYYNLSIGKTREGLISPVFDKRSVPTFVTERNDVVKGKLETQDAIDLCKALNVDAVLLYYTEWTLDYGKFVPTVKALTKNCVSMYDAKGKKLFYKRKDVRGEQTIGSAYSGVHVNEETIDNWVDASLSGIRTIFSKVRI